MSNMTSMLVDDNAMVVVVDETTFEYWSDVCLGLAFAITAALALNKMLWSQQQGGAETTVVTAFYSLICLTSLLRALWFLIPSSVWQPTYSPTAVMAFHYDLGDDSDTEENTNHWVGPFLSEIVLSAGSLCLFSIFILILVYWADILKKYFYPGQRRSRPMGTFLFFVSLLVAVEVVNAGCFLAGVYSSEGMILVNAITLATVSIICVCQITIFSHRFRTVLKTLGAINQVSTESQVRRIVWITVTGNAFFFTRAFIETIYATLLLVYWFTYGNVDKVFSHKAWDTYILLKHWSEVAILSLMLYILQSRFTAAARAGYEQVPEAELSPEANRGTGTSNNSNIEV